MKVEQATRNEYPAMIEVWESSVRATHDFLSAEDIDGLKPLILEQYFDAVELTCAAADDGRLLGFCGVLAGRIEMLFVAAEARGRGVGRLLTRHAVEIQGATKVDVNEQNPQAVGFYERMGFHVVGRSPLDGQGRPFPLLHMELGDAGLR
ncbi:putative N-acetyltransferase YjaB [Posidoniimonas corsicana]|uniref:Putative N-acetyltransferase YjaB n=1 Tax=Posidoniimonas corsicana TaxID=1938618 RepID=A0A5C5V7F2_9BACT|nr:acetyltransferase [Posidoniimonas corsicana]TWT33662.1 putative N-acetyltransferase YjaB [Posidoniimonas corsicana]